MTPELWIAFFGWSTILHFGLLLFVTLVVLIGGKKVYRLQHKWFPIDHQTYVVVIYGFIGLWKLFLITFCLVPYITLRIIF